MILIRNYLSLIRAKVLSIILMAIRTILSGKVKESSHQAKQVWDVLIQQGLVQKYWAVIKSMMAVGIASEYRNAD